MVLRLPLDSFQKGGMHAMGPHRAEGENRVGQDFVLNLKARLQDIREAE
jgi:hypothetical protein